MMDRKFLTGTLLPMIAGTIHLPNQACDKHDVPECLLSKHAYEYLVEMQFSAYTPLQMLVG
jgi:hypothetical protein